ncbi:MAG TPA: hypothetical protein VGY54_27200 [Polyangiaceae bacterium]|nr:hypothetical protein [Polyangiaceae bacterium]
MEDVIDFVWWRCLDGYEAVPTRRRGQGRRSASIGSGMGMRSKSRRFEPYEPCKVPSSALFRTVVDFPRTPDGMVSLSNAYGLINDTKYEGQRGTPTSEATLLDELTTQHVALANAIALLERGRRQELVQYFNRSWGDRSWGVCRHELRLDPDGRIYRVLVPRNLIHALWMQFAAHVESDAKLVRCGRCGQWFRTGTGMGRRDTAKWCSKACKQAAWAAKQGGIDGAGSHS